MALCTRAFVFLVLLLGVLGLSAASAPQKAAGAKDAELEPLRRFRSSAAKAEDEFKRDMRAPNFGADIPKSALREIEDGSIEFLDKARALTKDDAESLTDSEAAELQSLENDVEKLDTDVESGDSFRAMKELQQLKERVKRDGLD